MNCFLKKCFWCISLLLILGLQTSNASTSHPGPFKDIKLELLTDLTTKGPVRMSMIILPKWDYGDTLSFQLIGTNGLVSVGPDKQTISANEEGNFETEFEILIPDNDTSSLTIQVLPASPWLKQKCWFVTTSDTVEYWKGNPRFHNGPFRSDPPKGRRGRIIPGEFPDLDSIYGIPPDLIHPDYRPDSTPKPQYPSYTDAEIEAAVLERRRQEMREFEKTPLTGAGTQWIKIGDTMWTRRYGEMKFRVAQPITDFETHEQAVRDSLLAIPPSTMYDVLYQVKDTGQVATLRKHIDNLEPTRRADVYRCRISKGLIDMLEVRYRLTPTFVDQNPESLRELFDAEPDPDSGDSDQESHLDGPDKNSLIFYSENFENGWPPLWKAWDGDSLYSGADYWGISTEESYSGSRSIWCNGVGNMTDGGPYDNSCYAHAQNVDPFIVQYWHDERMRYQVWTDMPSAGWDRLLIMFSTGNDNWYTARDVRGTFGWMEYEDWFIGGDSLYFRFTFESNLNTFYRGAYLDDVVLRGTPYPNLEPIRPAGWADTMVLSSEQGTHQSGPLYGEEPTYVDFAVRNNQIGDAGPFSVGVFIGTTLYGSWPFPGLASGDTIIVEDAEVVFPVGEHNVVLKIDYVGGPGGEVDEIMELDNEWDGTFTFQDARIGFRGYLYYTDPTANPDTTIPLRGYTIALWDHNLAPWDDSITSAMTDDYGYFELGPVDNDDFWGIGELDVFFRAYSSNDAADVVVDHDGETQYWETPHVDDVPSGIYDTTMIANEDESGRFFVADATIDALQGWDTLPGCETPPQVEIELSVRNTTSYFEPDEKYIHIEEGYSYLGYRPNTFTRDVIMHEYAHYLQDTFHFLDEGGGPHDWYVSCGPRVAASEGFAHFFSCIVKNEPTFYRYRDNFADTAWYSVENCRTGINGDTTSIYASPNNAGPHFEAAVAGTFWDMYDDVVDDYSNGPPPPPPGDNGPDPDGIADSVYVDISEIMAALLEREVNGGLPDTLGEFWLSWFQGTPPRYRRDMGNLWYEHGDTTKLSCCIVRGNVDNDPGGVIDISDMVYLVDYMFTGGPLPPCLAQANVDGTDEFTPGEETVEDIDISDLVYIADYMFTGGPPPPPC